MKKVLVISDNFELVSFFKELEGKNDYSADFVYKFSARNKTPHDLLKLGMSPVNLKDNAVIDFLIETYDLVLSVHCKQIFPKRLVDEIRCINIHPGLNPYNRGWFPQVFSIINGMPIGCTIHEMDEAVDHGEIICQKEVGISPEDDSLTVYTKVQQAEKILISEYLESLISGDYKKSKMTTEGNYNSIDDFKKLCEIDLSSVGTFEEHINLLRALSHGDFNNAFFLKDGKKIFVKISLTKG